MKRVVLSVFFLLLGISLLANNFYLKIANNSYQGQLLQLYSYDNLLTKSEVFVADLKFDKDGKVNVECQIKKTPQLFFIPVYSFKLLFYAKKGDTIELKLPMLSKLKNYFKKSKTYSDREIPLYTSSNNTLNNRLNRFNQSYEQLLKESFHKLYNSKNTEFVEKEIESICKKTGDTNFERDYCFYKRAYLDYVANPKGNIVLQKYFVEQKILEDNSAYMFLLKKIAKDKAYDFMNTRLYALYRDAKSYNTLMTVAQRLTENKDTTFNELFLISMINEGTKVDFLQRHRSLKFLRYIKLSTKSAYNQYLANKVFDSLRRRSNRKLPKIELESSTGKKIGNVDFEGKEVPSLFVFIDNEVYNNEMIMQILELQKLYKNTFEVIVFECGFISKPIPQLSWQQFFLPYQYRLQRDFNLGKYPYLVLVDKDGNISEETWQQFFAKSIKSNSQKSKNK